MDHSRRGDVTEWLVRWNSNPKTLVSIPWRGRVSNSFSIPRNQLLYRLFVPDPHSFVWHAHRDWQMFVLWGMFLKTDRCFGLCVQTPMVRTYELPAGKLSSDILKKWCVLNVILSGYAKFFFACSLLLIYANEYNYCLHFFSYRGVYWWTQFLIKNTSFHDPSHKKYIIVSLRIFFNCLFCVVM